MAKVVQVSLIENYTNYGFGEAGRMFKSSESVGDKGVEFRVPSQYNRGAVFCLNYWDANCVGRDEIGGPVAQRASASLSAQATVISATPYPRPKVIDLDIGDYVVDPALDVIFRVTAGGRFADPGVEIVTCPEATVDYSELVAAKNAEPKRYISESWLSG